ncbi:MAG: ABC transporter substrate-binding protein, partial [Nanoarchaeota archaeon]|nr:ABC transporter substrate-binding protein [Nanoarchaeota archaeon]
MKKFSALIMALMIFMMGFTSVLAVEGAPEGSALTSESYTGIDKGEGVKSVAQIRQQSNIGIRNLDSARIKELQDLKIQTLGEYNAIKKETVNMREIMIRKRAMLKKYEDSSIAPG